MTPTFKQQLSELLLDIRHSPVFFASYVIGFIRLFFTNVDVLSLLIFAVLVGFAASPLVGGVAFFGGYVLTRSLDAVAGGLYGIASAVDIFRIHGRG